MRRRGFLRRWMAALGGEPRSCRHCRSVVPGGEGEVQSFGWCHRAPPTFISEGTDGAGKYAASAAWPAVGLTHGWCHEFRRG